VKALFEVFKVAEVVSQGRSFKRENEDTKAMRKKQEGRGKI